MMNIILLSKNGKTRRLDLSRPTGLLGLLVIMGGLLGSLVYGGYRLAEHQLADRPLQEVEAFRADISRQMEAVEAMRRETRENLNAFSFRLGQLNAHVIRLDALGDRLTRMAGLEEGEFNFIGDPAQGGPESTEAVESESLPQLLTAMDETQRRIESQEAQLMVLENLLMSRNLKDQVTPGGRPIRSGWLSSYFGVRTDPFTGKRARHYGLDFAGKEGADVVATGAGVVTFAGPRYGYGNMVEINHGNGLVTRYAHNKEILVKVGEVVKKGQTISLMGSSGRSTGPHVHFEVLKNGRVVNPLTYIED
ncbi:MAG: M23 family metallopeptidase [Gammaproteobacteria bacterium]|nr:M23 family metallopeptidase [Gammaproteobacteria bacterium]